MADTEEPHASPSSPMKPRISYACEACRVAKVKCQSGTVEGICRRCSASKRECVFKVGPRTRRRRSKLHPAATRSTPPPSAPSKTFTIDVPISAEEGFDDDPSLPFEALRETHEEMLRNLVDQDEVPGESSDHFMIDASSSISGSQVFSTPTPSIGSRSAHSMSNIQPKFNLDSAAYLLTSFKDSMLPYFPMIILPSDIKIPVLAKERPFILLAILAAASGGTSLQGHNLYDEEFRKVLGLKFVSSGERSVELLIGILIYCAWYPFHLRPKNKQASQYIGMACDIARDLELDQPKDGINFADARANSELMNNIRAYLAAQYLCSGFAATWQKSPTLPFQNWTATCCDILTSNDNGSASKPDSTLAWLVRLQHLVAETAHLNKRESRGGGVGGIQGQDEEQHVVLIHKGLEAQLLEFRSQIPPEISSQPVLRLSTLFTEIILYGSPLLKYPYGKVQKRHQSSSATLADTQRLMTCTTLLRSWYDYILSLPASEFSHFPGVIWGHLIASIILGLRLSFPLPNTYYFGPTAAAGGEGGGVGGWDHATARQTLDFGGFLTKFSQTQEEGQSGYPSGASTSTSTRKTTTTTTTTTTTSTDVLSASKVVINMVKQKFDKRLAALERADAEASSHHHPGHELEDLTATSRRSTMKTKCPMLDGSLDQYIQDWDPRLFDPVTTSRLFRSAQDVPVWSEPGFGEANNTTTSGLGSQQPLVFHDLWATMTMGWSQDGLSDVDLGG